MQPDGLAPQPRWAEVVDLPEALKATAVELSYFRAGEAHPGVPLFSGGLLDAWPATMVDALMVLRREAEAIDVLDRQSQRREADRGRRQHQG